MKIVVGTCRANLLLLLVMMIACLLLIPSEVPQDSIQAEGSQDWVFIRSFLLDLKVSHHHSE
jgi:hypothetical protein